MAILVCCIFGLSYIDAFCIKSILQTQGPICKILGTIAQLLVVVKRLSFFESAILSFFFQKKKKLAWYLFKLMG